MRSLEEIIKEANARGFMLNNLFQLRSHPFNPNDPAKIIGWQANFHNMRNGWYDFGRGDTAVEAMEDALKRAMNQSGAENRPIPRNAPAPRTEEQVVEEDPFS